MLCLIFIISQRFIAYKPDDASSQNHLIIDFGGRFIKGGLTGSKSKTISFLYKDANCLKKVSNDCYSIPNSVSGSSEYMLWSENPEVMVRVGEKGYDWVVKSKNDAYQYFGAFYNLKYSYLKKNYNLFNIPQNINISQHPNLWYLKQIFKIYQNETKAKQITIILPGYYTSTIANEMKLICKDLYDEVNIIKDYEVIRRVHSNIFNKNVLYLDFGSFSTKATVISNESEIVSFGFNEDCGLELVAYREARKIFDGDDFYGENHVFEARNKSYEIISQKNFNDELFEKNLNILIKDSIFKSKLNIDEIILIGGGSEIPFVKKTVDKIAKLKKIKWNLIDNVRFKIKRFNYLTFLVEGCTLETYKNPNYVFIYQPFYIKYGNRIFRIPRFSNLIKKPFDNKFRVIIGKVQGKITESKLFFSLFTKNQTKLVKNINITTDNEHVISGMPKKLKSFVIDKLEFNETTQNMYLALSGSYKSDKYDSFSDYLIINDYIELCNDAELNLNECNIKIKINETNIAENNVKKAEKEAEMANSANIYNREDILFNVLLPEEIEKDEKYYQNFDPKKRSHKNQEL